MKSSKLPNPKWIPIVATLLVIWAIALGVWWSRLQGVSTLPLQPMPAATSVAPATPKPGETTQPLPQPTPIMVPVVREAGHFVRQEDWLTLAQTFRADRALADIAELISPKYAGRAVGSPGGKLAAEWIAARFAEYGLQPAGDNGTYFQEFSVPYAELTAMPTLQIIDDTGQVVVDYQFREHYMVWLGGYADAGSAEGPVIWVSDGRHDDYNGLNAAGAIVLCRYRYALDDILRQALEHGAKAVLLARPDSTSFPMRRQARQGPLLPQGIPTLIVGPKVLQGLLAGSGLTIADLTILYQSRPLATRVRLDVPLRYDKKAQGRNVLGVLPGSDPDGINQIVILGAHYDHLGADPDGTVWGGANDNASGVAVLLEIARLWHEQGYVPQRTVLFAAWDGEEIGLYGSEYYVKHPSFPLTNTVGMLQLDMVGAGTPKLLVDAGGLVADQSLVSAAQLGIEVETQSMGRSDHAPFVGAGVPATLYIWWDGVTPGVIYHVPEDNLANIEPAKLQAAGKLANLVLLQLSWTQEELEDAAAVFERAVETMNLETLQEITHAQDKELLLIQEEWLKGLSLRQPAEFSVTVGSPLIATDIATTTVTIRSRWKPEESPAIATFPAKWVRRGLDWYYGGPTWDEAKDEHVRVLHLQQPALAQSLIQEAKALYAFLKDTAGLTLPEIFTVRFYGSDSVGTGLRLSQADRHALLHALHNPPPGYEGSTGWSVSDGIVLSTAADSPTLFFEFALRHAGWPAQTTSWLAQGLADCWRSLEREFAEELAADYMPLLLEADRNGTLWSAEELPTRNQVEALDHKLWQAQAWAMAHYLLQTHGWEALQYPFAMDFDGWRTALLTPWQLASEGISQTLEQRSTAILSLDKAGFLATVNPQDTVLYQEETYWFDSLQEHHLAEFAYESQLLGLDNTQALAQLTVKYRLASESSPRNITYNARFIRADNRWLYADVAFHEQHNEHFVLKYQHPDQALYADKVLNEAEQAYALIAADLDFHPTQPIEIKVYDNSELLPFSISPSMPEVSSWTALGTSLKLGIEGWRQSKYEGIGRIIAQELAHAALFSKGVQHTALHEGIAHFEACTYDPAWCNQETLRQKRQAYDWVRSNRPVTLAYFANQRDLTQDEIQLLEPLGWDFVTYFRQGYGQQVFLGWLNRLGSGTPFEQAFAQTTGTPFADFDTAWRESVLRGHIPESFITTAWKFDAERALAHLRNLAQPAWAGREAGTPGNEAAARYIADQFAAYGLQPAGDNGTYFQSFAISRTALIATPELTLIEQEGKAHPLQYRVDFREVLGGHAGSGEVQSTIVYMRNLENQDIQLGGRILLTYASPDPWKDAENAVAHGAGALLLITDKWSKDMSIKMNDIPSPASSTIPVYELSREAFELLLSLAGYRTGELEKTPPALPLLLSARISLQLESTAGVSVSNVLGILPGSDPELADEVLILGAHFDHVGHLPDGTFYPGANNDASGVAVLLEIARLWQEERYHPCRTVLFAAWNATEKGMLGSNYYVAHPACPLTSTLSMIQLDMVGQGRGYYINVYAQEQQDALILAHLDNAARQVEGRLTFVKYEGGSDHEPFHALGIPAIMMFWERPEYVHMPDDTADLIDPKKLQATGRLLALALMTLAEQP